MCRGCVRACLFVVCLLVYALANITLLCAASPRPQMVYRYSILGLSSHVSRRAVLLLSRPSHVNQSLITPTSGHVTRCLSTKLDFSDTRVSYKGKSTWELLRAFFVYKLFSYPKIIDSSEKVRKNTTIGTLPLSNSFSVSLSVSHLVVN